MRTIDSITAIIAITARVLSIIIMLYLVKKQRPALSLPKNKDTELRQTMMILLILLLIQNIIPIFAIAAEWLTPMPINMSIYFINNSLFSLAGASILLTIYKTK